MKIKDFIVQWIQATPVDTTIVIPTTEEATPVFQITTTGNSKIKHFYSWSCTDKLLYYKDDVVCCKTNGIFITKEQYQNQLKDIFKELDIVSYAFINNYTEYNEYISKTLKRFYDCAIKALPLDEILLQVVQKLNIQYENKYLNYCKNLELDSFSEISTKHYFRQEKREKPHRILNGLWYSFDKQNEPVCAMPSGF